MWYNTPRIWGQQRLPVSTMNHKHSTTNNQPRTTKLQTTNNRLRTMPGPSEAEGNYERFTFLCKTNPISKKAQMNVSKVLTKDYENIHPSGTTKTNPNQTQSNPISKQKPGKGSGLNYLDWTGKKAYRGQKIIQGKDKKCSQR